MNHITSAELALWRSHGFDFRLLDVRRARLRDEHGAAIAGAGWLDPAAWLDWKDSIGAARPVEPITLVNAPVKTLASTDGAAP